MRLSDLKLGEKARIVCVEIGGKEGRRYREMGLVSGEIVRVVRVAPLGDPVEIEVKGYNLSLRKDEARRIRVEVVR
ncbi:FeoA family protein [Ferroglobus placidus DSM 10642]|uniref:FeoA family protein n=1 Tax=Ferroglobus placidus (strain DSM 10642 / AEDII12DO) TaxID=589924 RepID=D3S2Y7_FERPA|nr:FeoA family protein [Ferroglobus placidus]ADC64620.1 FeoA family protein [Ferroglobus placidus DSM 10642]